MAVYMHDMEEKEKYFNGDWHYTVNRYVDKVKTKLTLSNIFCRLKLALSLPLSLSLSLSLSCKILKCGF